MRIISKHHDYYDAAMAQGQDMSLIYLRQMSQFEDRAMKDIKPPLKGFVEFCEATLPGARNIYKPSKQHSALFVHYGLVCFAGKLYPYAQVRRTLQGVLGHQTDECYLYTLKEVLSVLKEHGVDGLAKSKDRHTFFGSKPSNLEAFFALDGSDRFLAITTEFNLPVLSYERSTISLTINPRLADLQFFKRQQTFEAYQNLSQFLGNIASPDNTPVLIEDKYRIAQHGFDKQSFRKRAA